MVTDDEISRGLRAVAYSEHQSLELSDDLAWLKHRIGKFVLGGVYLIAGQPGIGKSTLGIQIGLDIGRRGKKTLYILTEENKESLKQRAEQMSSMWPTADKNTAMDNMLPEENVYDLESLPTFLAHQVLNPSGRYNGVDLIILDSVQGHGLPAGATKKYRQLYEFCRQCKAARITVLLVAHVTKAGDIAGPKDLEHNVDCVLVMRKAMVYRPLFVPKNRFGPAILKPIPLEMDPKTTNLKLSPYSESVSSVARVYLGRGGGMAEAQAVVALPAYGARGRITAPGLPKKEIEQLTTCMSQIQDMDIGDLDYTIQCRLPGERNYRRLLGLPLSMALIASYIQRDIPGHHIYMGEIDLLRRVCEVPDQVMQDLWEEIQNGNIKTPARIFCPPSAAEVIQNQLDGVTVVSCVRLDDAVFNTWPELRVNHEP